jgi:hypothetical protein
MNGVTFAIVSFAGGYAVIDWLIFHGHVTSWFLGWL